MGRWREAPEGPIGSEQLLPIYGEVARSAGGADWQLGPEGPIGS